MKHLSSTFQLLLDVGQIVMSLVVYDVGQIMMPLVLPSVLLFVHDRTTTTTTPSSPLAETGCQQLWELTLKLLLALAWC